MNHDEEKPDEKDWGDFWSAKPGTVLPQMHHTLEEGAWTEIPVSFSALPLFLGDEVRFVRYRITERGDSNRPINPEKASR